MSKEYQQVTKAQVGDWVFQNNTTACIITLRLKDPEDNNLTRIVHMDYYQYEQLLEMIEIINTPL